MSYAHHSIVSVTLSLLFAVGCGNELLTDDTAAATEAVCKAGCHSHCPDDATCATLPITLEGQPNMRDLGGIVGAAGRRLLRGKLFRAGDLSSLTDADQAVLNGLGIEQVLDLRTDDERLAAPDWLPLGATAFDIPLVSMPTSGPSEEELMAAIVTGQLSAHDYMISLYGNIDDFRVAAWTQVFELLQTGKPTLFHCTAGKDRAGMTAALILSALGVDRNEIVKDYLDSNIYLKALVDATVDYLDAMYADGVGELLRPVLIVEQSYIEAFFDSIESHYGTVQEFLDALNVDRHQLRRNLLERHRRLGCHND